MQVGADLVRLTCANGMTESTTPLEDGSTLGSVTWKNISLCCSTQSQQVRTNLESKAL